MEKKREGLLIVISGFAGTGKGTIVKRLVEDYEQYALSVSMTTRAPRPGEVDGKSYFFVTKEEFEKNIEENRLVEYASYCDNYYGTPRAYVEEMLQQGKDIILEIEIQGALKIRKMFPTALLLFMMPPSAEELKRRLVGRGTETMEVVEKRMTRAATEAAGIDQYDYIVINDEVDACVARTHSIIEAAHAKPQRNIAFIKEMQEELRQMATSHN
ncbi:MAG: guanylate kinase [Lachnospiraceae bacterium]